MALIDVYLFCTEFPFTSIKNTHVGILINVVNYMALKPMKMNRGLLVHTAPFPETSEPAQALLTVDVLGLYVIDKRVVNLC